MEKLNELLRAYAQSIRRDDGTAFTHADEIRALFEEQAAEPKGLTPEWLWSEFMDYCKAQGRAPSECKRLFEIVTRARALLANGE